MSDNILLEEFREHRREMRRDMNGVFKRLNSLEVANGERKGAEVEAKKHERNNADKRTSIISAVVAGAVAGIGFLIK